MGSKHGRKGILRRVCAGTLALVMALGGVSASEVRALAAGETRATKAYAATDKPRVVIQGNAVVDKAKKATGFFELALCVQTTFVYTDYGTTSQAEVSWADYQQKLEDAAKKDDGTGTTANVDAVKAAHTVVEHPFQSASTAVTVNTDVLTVVDWNEEYPEYDKWDTSTGGSGGYSKETAGTVTAADYPRGLDTSALANYFDLTKVDYADTNSYLSLMTAGPDEGVRAEAVVEGYDKESRTALVTLVANAANNRPVNYTEPTPVVVIRFAYDKARFSDTVRKENESITDVDFWMNGVNKEDIGSGSTQQSLVYFVDTKFETDLTKKQGLIDAADELVANSSVEQFVKVQTGCDSTNQEFSQFYYYLGADDLGAKQYADVSGNLETEKVTVSTGANTTVEVDGEKLVTAGQKVMAWKDEAGTKTYSYLYNLLSTKGNEPTLRFELVNQETYRPATGGKGGIQILFYDWDDTLIGATIVDETGDAREDVERYVEENMVHPDLRRDQFADHDPATTAGADYANLCDSLDRKWTYRGKYSYKPGAANDAVSTYKRENGEDYPLTNKLDYVFYKRVNGVTEISKTETLNGTTTTTDSDYYSTHSLSQFTDGREYPYVYGWALVGVDSFSPADSGKVRQDAKKIEDIWTTFGAGELDGSPQRTSSDGDLASEKTLAGGANTVYPTWLTESDEGPANAPTATPNGEDWEATYQFATSNTDQNDYLKFADFSDMAKLVTQNGQKRDTIIVKAVYEQGTSLRAEMQYALTSPISYNKLNNVTAEKGGVYSADITFERMNTDENGDIVGVGRTRMPTVRQNTTYDLHWEETEEGGVRQTLTNATSDEANVSRTKTLYAKVDVENKDVIEFQLSLSARHNKVDYFLAEGYGLSFVTGGERVLANYRREDGLDWTQSEYVIDNYNYYVAGESDTTDEYYDASYEDRVGSHGFVLYGTLNKIMQAASEYDEDQAEFEEATNYLVLQDTNLRRDAAGNQPNVAGITALRNKILDAAKEARQNHYGDPDYWNSRKDCAELSYHQIQWYILDGVLYSRAAADAKKLFWCHLHDECVALNSGKPTDWVELMDLAKGGTQTDKDKIAKLTTEEIAGTFKLRFDASGSKFSSSTDFANAIVTAVGSILAADQSSTLSWEEVQQALVNDSLLTAKENFWWITSSTSKPTAIGSLSTLVTGLEEYRTGVTLPDGSTVKPVAKLLPMEELITKNNASELGQQAHGDYVSATENLVLRQDTSTDESGKTTDTLVKFTDFDSEPDGFLQKVSAAHEVVLNAGYSTGDDDYWYKLQWAILKGDLTGYTQTKAKKDFYWHNGAVRITDLNSMLEAAVDSDQTRWDDFDLNAYGDLGLYFSTKFDGTGVVKTGVTSDADWTAFKAALKAFADANPTGNLKTATWKDVQYWLLHEDGSGEYSYNEANSIIEYGYGYYWWEGGATEGAAQAFSSTDLALYIRAAFKRIVNGNRNAWGDSTKAQVRALERLRMVKGTFADITGKIYTFDELAKYQAEDLNDFHAAMETLVSLAIASAEHQALPDSKHTEPTLTVYEVQYYLLTGTYKSDADLGTEKDGDKTWKERMWWIEKDEADDKPKATEPPQSYLDEFAKISASGVTITYGKMNTELYLLNNGSNWTNRNANTYKTRLKNLVTSATGQGVEWNSSNISWYQLQYALLADYAGQYTDQDTAKSVVEDLMREKGKDWRPAWLYEMDGPISDGSGGTLANANVATASLTAALMSLDEDDDWAQEMAALLAALNEEQRQQMLEYLQQLTETSSADQTEGELNSDGEGGVTSPEPGADESPDEEETTQPDEGDTDKAPEGAETTPPDETESDDAPDTGETDTDESPDEEETAQPDREDSTNTNGGFKNWSSPFGGEETETPIFGCLVYRKAKATGNYGDLSPGIQPFPDNMTVYTTGSQGLLWKAGATVAAPLCATVSTGPPLVRLIYGKTFRRTTR